MRDGLCKQSEATNVYSFGRLMSMMNRNANIQSQAVKSLPKQCMQYDTCLLQQVLNSWQSILVTIVVYISHYVNYLFLLKTKGRGQKRPSGGKVSKSKSYNVTGITL